MDRIEFDGSIGRLLPQATSRSTGSGTTASARSWFDKVTTSEAVYLNGFDIMLAKLSIASLKPTKVLTFRTIPTTSRTGFS